MTKHKQATTTNGQTMTQAYLEGIRTLSFRQLPVPEPGPGEVLVRIHTALTCGTDLKTFRRGHAKLPVPGPIGHEAAGTVVAIGRGAGPIKALPETIDTPSQPGTGGTTGGGGRDDIHDGLALVDVNVGDAVMWSPTAPCGHCSFCEQNLFNQCETLFDEMALGTYADYILVPERIVRQHMFLKPDRLPFAEAALMEPFACILRGWRRLEADGEPIDSVLILGVGAIALQHVALAKARGVKQITVVGGRPSGLEAARRLGAHHAVAGHLPDVEATLRAQGLATPDVVIECTGNPDVWALAPSLVRIGGKAMLFGGLAGGTDVPFSAHRIHYDEVTLLGSFHYVTADLVEAYRLIATGAVQLGELISGTRPLEDLLDVFAQLEGGEGIKYALRPAHADGSGPHA